jgi:hypothetical protein
MPSAAHPNDTPRFIFLRVGLRMKFLATVIILLTLSSALSPVTAQERATPESCRESEKLFYNAPPISILSAKEQSGIIRVVRPDLQTSESKMGFDPQDLTPARLLSLLRYTELALGTAGERIAVVTFQDPNGCGNHGQCTGYLVAVGPHGVRSLAPKTKQFGLSIGATWGAAVLPRKESAYPDLLVLATVSGSEVAVGCYRWQGTAYDRNCDVPCAQLLAHPDQQ